MIEQVSWINKNKLYNQWNYNVTPGGVVPAIQSIATITFPEVRPSERYVLTAIYLGQSFVVPAAAVARMLDAVIVNINGARLNPLTASATAGSINNSTIARVQLSAGQGSVQNLNLQLTESVIAGIDVVSVAGFIATDQLFVQLLFEFEFIP